MKQILFHVLLLWQCAALYAQTSTTISGSIKDAQNGETLIGATVEALGLQKGNSSNEYGFYSLSVPIGKDSIA